MRTTTRRSVAIGALFCCLLMLLQCAWALAVQSPPSAMLLPAPSAGDAALDAVLAELQGFIREVVEARGLTQTELDRASGAGFVGSALARELGGAASRADAGLYAGQIHAADEWMTRLRNRGSVDQPYLVRIRDGMREWRTRNEALLELLKSLAAFRDGSQFEVPGYCAGSEAPVCTELRTQVDARRSQVLQTIQKAATILKAAAPTITLDGPAPAAVECTTEKPDSIRIDSGSDSAVLGEWSQILIVLTSRSSRPAKADIDYEIDVEVSDGEVGKTRVIVRRESCSTPNKVAPKKPKPAVVRATAPQLKTGERKIAGCDIGRVVRMDIGIDATNEGPADGVTPIRFSFQVFGDRDNLITDRQEKTLAIRPTTATRSGPTRILANECFINQELRSDNVGPALVQTTFRGQPVVGNFVFTLPITLGFVLLVLGAAVLGALLHIALVAPRGLARVIVWLVGGLVSGVGGAVVAYLVLARIGPVSLRALVWQGVEIFVSALFGFGGLPSTWRWLRKQKIPGTGSDR